MKYSCKYRTNEKICCLKDPEKSVKTNKSRTQKNKTTRQKKNIFICFPSNNRCFMTGLTFFMMDFYMPEIVDNRMIRFWNHPIIAEKKYLVLRQT